jgi:hypothetical protein
MLCPDFSWINDMRALVFVAMMAMSVHAASLDELLATAERLRNAKREGEIAEHRRVFRRELRDWIESRIPMGASGEQLMLELKGAGLASGEEFEQPLGSVAAIEITRPANYPAALAVKAGVGAGCGTDESWYLYVLAANGWKRIFEDERETPLTYSELQVSPEDGNGSHVVLITGNHPQCHSRFNGMQYRAFRINPFLPVRTLLDGDRGMDWHEDRNAALTNSEITIEFQSCCSEQNLTNRRVILKYKIDGDRTVRVDPVALNPQDFVDEWVHQPWAEMQNWTAKDSRARLEKWHKRFQGDKRRLPEFEFVQRCQRGGSWQIAAAELEVERTYYFLVSESTGGRYEMLDISTKRQPGCAGETPPDFTIRSIFPKSAE